MYGDEFSSGCRRAEPAYTPPVPMKNRQNPYRENSVWGISILIETLDKEGTPTVIRCVFFSRRSAHCAIDRGKPVSDLLRSAAEAQPTGKKKQ